MDKPAYVQRLLSNKEYKKYLIKKNKIKEKYSDDLLKVCALGKSKEPYPLEMQEEYKKYIKEIGDLMFKVNGDFQKFTWDDMSTHDKHRQNIRARGKLKTVKY